MKIAVFGGTGQVGSELVRQAVAAGHEVRALARRPDAVPPGATVIAGALDDEAAIRRAVHGADAVVSALGARTNTPEEIPFFGDALARITRVMRDEGVRRLVSISGAALSIPGDAPSFARTMVRALMSIVAKNVIAAKAREHEVIAATDLDWVLIRPGRIVPGEPTGTVRASRDGARPKVTAGDVAALMLRCTEGDEWIRAAPFVA